MKRLRIIYSVLIFLGLGGILYFVDYFGIVSLNLATLTDRVIGNEIKDEVIYENQELFLLKEQENQKLIEAINSQKSELDQIKLNLDNQAKELERENLALAQERKNLELEKEAIERQRTDENNYEIKINEIANQFLNMPPERAVERLVALGDDVLIIDILNRIDQQAEENDAISIVPYFYSLMPEADAARIIRKSSVGL